MLTKITIYEKKKPIDPIVRDDLDWICRSLGFVSNRDFEHTSSKIFKSIIKAMANDAELSSDDISSQVGVTRGAVVHHLKAYLDSGILIQKKRKYILRTRSIERTIDQVEEDVLRVLSDIKKIARELDERLGLKER